MARDIKKIDAKGRFFIPSKLKERFGGDVVITNSLDKGYLSVYTAEAFKEVERQLDELNSMDPNVRRIQRFIAGEALEVSVDSQGRLSVTSELWERIDAKPGDEICVFDILGKLNICTKAFYDNSDLGLDDIVGLDTKYYVKGL